MDETLSSLSKEEKWFQTLLPLPGAVPDNPSRSLESVFALNRRLDSLGLEEVQLNLDNEADSLFASFVFWEQRYASGLGPQLLAEKNTPFAAPVDRLAALRQQVYCPAAAHASFQTFYMFAKHFPYRIFIVFPDGTYCVPDTNYNATKNILMFSCCEKFFFRPTIFRHPNPSTGTYDLAANMFPFLGRILEASLTTDLPQLDIELSLGRDLVKDKIPAFKDKRKFVYDEDESSIVFFGPQQVGKSRTINNILQTSMASVTTDVYKLITCWYWHSFQTEWLEEEIIPWNDEDELDANEGLDRPREFVIEWGGVDLSAQPLPPGYVVPEGSAFSTTSVSTEIKFGCQFAISFIFHSEEFVAAELASYKRYLTMQQQGELQQEELDEKAHFRRGEVMIGAIEKPKPSDVKLNNTFANKLGRCVRYCSPHVDVAQSIEFIKSKYALYGASDQMVWGLLRSIIIEMPVPLLLGGGRLIDSPGLVVNDNVRREQTMAALHKASAVVYVASTQEFGDVAAEFQKSSFFMNYIRSIAEECLEAMKSQTELKRTVLPKLMFIFNSDKPDYPGSVERLKGVVNTHLKKLRSKFFESFRNPIRNVVSSVYRSQEQIPSFEEREFLQFVEDSLMSILNPLEDPLVPSVVKKSKAKKEKASGALEPIFVTAFNSSPNAPVANGRMTFMHALFKYARDKHISPEAAGIPLFLNTLKRILGVSYKSVGDKSGELMKQIHKELKNRLKMESIKDENFMMKINTRLEEIRKRVKRHFKDFENSAYEMWVTPKRQCVDEHVSKLLDFSDKCTGEGLLENLKQEMDTADQKKIDDALNRLCRQRGEALGISLTALALKPLWQGFDRTLQSLTELMLPSSPPKLPENEFDGFSISNQLQKVIDKSFALKEEDDEIVAKFIELEKKRFTKHIRNALKVFNFNQNFALEKESLKIFCQQKMELFLEAKEKTLKKAVKGIVTLREAYLKEGIKGYAEECCNEMRNRLGQRVKLIIENFVGHTRNSKLKLKQIVKRAGDGITQRYKKTADEKEIGALSKLQNYFKACMLSLYRSMIDNVVEHRQDIYDYVLKAMVEFDLGSGTDLPTTLDAIEWRNFLQAFTHTLDNRWSFLEKKAVVDFSITVSSKDTDTESNYVTVPTTHYKAINQLLKQKYPIANSGLERKQYAVKNLTVQLRNKFLTTKEAKEFFGCYLNVHEDVQRAFFPAAINLRNLQLRRLILLNFLEPNTFFDIEQLSELERMDMVANINNGLVEIARLNNNIESLEILQNDRQLIEAISLLQLEFETPQKAAEIIDQMLGRIQKRLKKRAVLDIPLNNNVNNGVEPAVEKKVKSASKKRKTAPAAKETKPAKKKRIVSDEESSHEPNPPKKKNQNRSNIDEPARGVKQPNNSNNKKPSKKKKMAVYEDDQYITEEPKSAKKNKKVIESSDDDEDDEPYIPKSVKKSQVVESDDDDEPFVPSSKSGHKKTAIESEDDEEPYFTDSDEHDRTKKGPKRRSQVQAKQTKDRKSKVKATEQITKASIGAKAKAIQKKKKVSSESDYDEEEESDFIVNDEDQVIDEMDYEESLVEESDEKPKTGTKRKRPVVESSDESSDEERLKKKKR